MDQQQKVLYVVFSVIVVVVAVCAIAVVFLLPPQEVVIQDESVPGSREARTETFDPSTWVQDGENVPEFTPEEPDDGIIVIGASDDNGTAGAEGTSAGSISIVQADEASAAKQIPTSVPTAADIEKPSAPPLRSSQASSSASAKPRTVRTVEYWIQAGSFTSRSRAEASQDELKKSGFNCLITSKTVGGTNHFRLRLGPYEDKNEADKFLGWIRGLDNYSGSYVTEVYTQKTL